MTTSRIVDPVDKVLSVLSCKLREELAGYFEADRYLRYTFTIVKDSLGTVPSRIS